MLEQPERLNADDLIAVEIAVEAGVSETNEGVVPTVVLLVAGRVGPDFTRERTVRIHMLAEEVAGVSERVVRAGTRAMDLARKT
ncbi:MAG: hypothetical protein ACRDWG_11885 [Actinomycetes bacterium]|jgi:hypothetical protein